MGLEECSICWQSFLSMISSEAGFSFYYNCLCDVEIIVFWVFCVKEGELGIKD